MEELEEDTLKDLQETVDRITARFEDQPIEQVSKKAKLSSPGPILISHPPSVADVGVEEDLLRLCATISSTMYDCNLFSEFQSAMQALNASEAVPYDDLSPRWYDKGVTVAGIPPQLQSTTPFAAVITGNTLILSWRGTYSVFDVLADLDFQFGDVDWDEDQILPNLKVQAAFNKKMAHNISNHAKDIVNYIEGKYNKTDRNKPNVHTGTPIRRILLTGHSLGGGLAAQAHLELLRGPRECTPVIHANTVEVRTVVFCAPMSIALDSTVDPESETFKFLFETVQPNMRNLIYDTDVVPRGYANLTFMRDFLQAIEDYQKGNGVLNDFAKYFVSYAKKVLTQGKGVLSKYRHIGKLLYYKKAEAKSKMQVDGGFATKPDLGQGETSFYDIEYQTRRGADVIATELAYHGAFTGTNAGLTFDTTS